MRMGRVWFLLLVVSGLVGCAAALPGERYDSADEPKAKGLHIQVNYPSGWKKGSGDRGNMLADFTRESEAMVETLMLQVHEIDEAGAGLFFPLDHAKPQDERYGMWEKTINSLSGKKLLAVTDTAVPSGRPAVLIELMTLPNPSDGSIYVRMKMLHLYEKGRMVVLSCGAGNVQEKKAEVDVLLEEGMAPVCRAYFDSLRFVE